VAEEQRDLGGDFGVVEERESEGGGVEGRMEESDWMADWVLEGESDGADVECVGFDVLVPAPVPSGLVVGVSSDIEREGIGKTEKVELAGHSKCGHGWLASHPIGHGDGESDW
jgi:hypothetical protein